MEFTTALYIFLFLAVELLVLFLGISLLVGASQRHISPETIESRLNARSKASCFMAAGLGSLTPYCSCSTIPMLKALLRAHAGFGPMMVFIFSSPLLNSVVVVLLIATFGWQLTAIYVLAAFLPSLGARWLFWGLKFARSIIRKESESEEKDMATSCCASATDKPRDVLPRPEEDSCSESRRLEDKRIFVAKRNSRYDGLWKESWVDFCDVLPYLLLGIAVGSIIYGFVPTTFLEKYTGSDNALAIPFAAIIGVPLHLRAEAVNPLVASLLAKGFGTGSVLALIIGSAGASLTELILLRALFDTRLLIALAFVIFSLAIIEGYVTHFFYSGWRHP
ncbi:MAG: permease [Verrucomicrobiota bacterium JB023]|nr:permease [Verrucomicrobiota bacterium JB023]